jgi:exonuclease SbcC
MAKWSLWRSRGNIEGRVQEPKRELSKWNPSLESFEIIGEKIREVDENIEAFTGLDYDRFRRSVLLAQGDFAAFLDADEKERSELLEKITGTEIYSELSKAAYERHKIEREHLDRLKMEMESLKVLSEEELEALRTQLKDIRQEVSSLKKERNTLATQLNTWQRLRQQQKKQQDLNATIAQLEQEAEALQKDFTQLQHYEKAKVFLQELNILDERVQNVAETAQELNRLDKQLESLRQQQEQLAKESIAARQEWTRQKDTFRQQEVKWREARDLDKKLEGKKSLIEGLEEEHQTLVADVDQRAQELRQVGQKQEAVHEELEGLKDWLHHHRHLDRLQSNLSGLSREMQDWQKDRVELHHMEQAQEKMQQRLKKLDTEGQQLQEEVENEQTGMNDLKAQLKAIMPQQVALRESQLVELVHQNLDKLIAQQNELEKLQQKNQEYQALLEAQQESQEEVEHLRAEETYLLKELMTVLQQYDDGKKQLAFKTSVYEQQQLVANYEKDRAALKEGDPCPLCFSREHPFRKAEYQPFVNEARLEYEKAKKQFEALDQQYRNLQTQHQSLVLALEQHLQRAEKFRRKVLDWEADFQKALERGGTQDIQLVNLTVLGEKIRENNRQVSLLKKQKSELGHLLKTLETKKEALAGKEERLRTLKSDYRVMSGEFQTRQKQVEGQLKRVRNLKERIDRELEHFQIKVDEKNIEVVLKQLSDWKDEFSEKGKRKVEAERRLGILNKELEQLQREQKKSQGALQKKEAALEKERQLFADEKKRRYQILEDKDPDQEKAAFEQLLDQLEEKREQTRSSLEEIKRQIDATSAAHKKDSAQLKRLQELKKEQEASLLAGLKKAGIGSIESLRAINLSEEEVEAIRQRKENLKQQEIENRRVLQDTNKEVNELEAQVEQWPEAAVLQEQLDELDEQYSSRLKQEGALQEQIQQADQLKEEASGLRVQLKKQQKECNRWAKLNDVIGMADGKKFRIFAQALTLEKLIYLANEHLSQLNGRYVIEKLKGDDLALEIIDTYQANHRRSMNTLSGGERFLVSLSLALGLSDLAGRQSQIQSLFIDEGFGTLDDNSLDMVLSTLENLQSSGKTIGVISHVKELKERIGTQIQLIKQENGFSKLKIVG